MNKILPIGSDSFYKIRKNDWFYIDKSLMIRDFIKYQDTAALITRPRRFGKTLNMTMLREFFDITKDSRQIFKGLKIMETEYKDRINSKPVIFFSFKDCTGRTKEDLKINLITALFDEYSRYGEIFKETVENSYHMDVFYADLQKLMNREISYGIIGTLIANIIRVVNEFYHIPPILLIDEYDQPILSSYENGYREELIDFFSSFYGSALKGNAYLGQALLTGIQRVAKESIFSKLNNIKVYTVIDKRYCEYFGLTEPETKAVLEEYGMKLSEAVKLKYDGYLFYNIEIYNPLSILNYIENKILDDYWVNTSTNTLIHKALKSADNNFLSRYYKLIENGNIEVGIKLDTSFIELSNEYTLWGLLVNSGYLTIYESTSGSRLKKVCIPNEEVKSEFQTIIAEQAGILPSDLELMFEYLLRQDMVHFMEIYKNIVLTCTSYHDVNENAYHMLFLGMCISLRNLYKVTSNLESGYGRHDICLRALSKGKLNIIVEFKQGENIEKLKKEALNQIIDQKYYAGLYGSVLCIGIAHNIKKCDLAYQMIEV